MKRFPFLCVSLLLATEELGIVLLEQDREAQTSKENHWRFEGGHVHQ